MSTALGLCHSLLAPDAFRLKHHRFMIVTVEDEHEGHLLSFTGTY